MSLLSRMTASPAAGDLAGLVADLLSAAAPAAGWHAPGPTGLGTTAARLPAAPAADREAAGREASDRESGRRVPHLYCPPPLRDDPALGDAVNDALIDWAGEIGIYPDRLEKIRETNFGRLIMLAHPDTDDQDRLLAAAKCALAEWSVDDHYCDDESAGADPAQVGARLLIAYAAADPAPLPKRYAPQLERALSADPVLAAIRSALDHLARYATPAQVNRLRREIAALWLGCNGETTWRTTGRMPPAWEYLANRSRNSFLPCIALIDPVAAYEVPGQEYAQPRVRRAVTMAATAATLVNDLYSMTVQASGGPPDISLPTVIAAEDGCSLREAIDRSAAVHDELVATFETEAAALPGTPQLRRYLAGVWAWLGGNHEWHATTARYQTAATR